MAFQHWEIPGGQAGEGENLQAAVDNAVGRAILRNNVEVSYLMSGRCYDLSVPGVDHELGLAVVSEHLAVLVSMPRLPLGVWGRVADELPLAVWPRIRMMPEEVSFQTMHRAWFIDEPSGQTGVRVYRAVRHEESTTAYTDWLLKRHTL